MNSIRRALRDRVVIFNDIEEYQKHIERVLKIVLATAGTKETQISQNEAHKIYGRYVVNSWIDMGLVKKIKDGEGNCKVRLSMTELEAAALTSNRCEWYDMNAKKTVNQ